MVELVYVFIQAVIYGGMIYAMIGFERTVTKFLFNLFFTYFTFLYFTFFGMMTVAITPNQNIAALVASAFYSMWNLFSGFFLPRTVSMYGPFPLI
jgi:ABC-type multidrug transport system permease subunit